MMAVVVVVVVVIVVVAGGEQLLYMGPPEPMYGLVKFKRKTPYFLFSFQKPMSGLNAHVWWIQEVKEGGRGGPSSF